MLTASCKTAEMPPSQTHAQPPVARREPHVSVIHGQQRVDDYYWLRQKTNPRVRQYLEAENAHTLAITKPTAALQEKLYGEMVGRIQETDVSVPYREGDYLYYTRTEEGKQYPIYCRRKNSVEAAEEITLDLNAMARGEEFLDLGAYNISDDSQLLAYTIDTTGFREYVLFVKNLRTGVNLSEKISHVASVAWAADNNTLFYVTEDAAKRPYRLYRHSLGEGVDELLYEETDEMFSLEVDRSRSKAFIFVAAGSKTADEVRFLRADRPNDPLKIIAPREKDHEYSVDHGGDLFYIRTNDRGRNFRVVTVPVTDPRRENWQELIAHSDQVMIDDLLVFKNFYALVEREDGLPQIRVAEVGNPQPSRIEFPEETYAVGPEINAEFDTPFLRFSYESLTTPPSVYDYDVRSRQRTLLKREIVKGDFDPAHYVAARLFATAPDGTRVPVSIVYRKGTPLNGQNPLLLYGYGAYGIPNDVWFSASRLSLLDRGVVFAAAHVRGGGELGKKWHDQGRMMNKRNTFTDFIAVAEFLIARGYTSKEHLSIEGASAGGLLVGAVLNLRPDLFHAAIVDVPFVDVINTMLDPTLPLTVAEFEEWGNPQLKDQFDYLLSYSPYDNIAATNYPALLVETSLNDSQVMYWEPAKYVAKLRATKTDNNPLLFKINMAGGHSGKSGRYDQLHERAFDYAFLLSQWGITE